MPAQKTPLFTLYATSVISSTGDVMAAIAIPWFVLQTTGSAVQMGITGFFAILPIALAMFFGGTLVDRTGYKRVSVLADMASGLTMLLIPILHWTVGLEFWQLLALVFLGNLLDAPGSSARQAMLPELATHADFTIDRATGISQTVERITKMVGSPLAGILVATLSPAFVLVVNAITFFISAIGIQALIPASIIPKPKHEGTSYIDDLKAGFNWVRADRLMPAIILVVMLTNMIDTAMYSVAMPVYFNTTYGTAVSMGIYFGVMGFFAVLGTIAYSAYGSKYSRYKVFIVSFMAIGVQICLFLLFPPFWGILLLTMFGIFAGPLNPILMSVSYGRIPNTMRARVFGLLSAGALIAMPAGSLISGLLIENIGLSASIALYGGLYLLVTGSMIFNPAIREMDAPPLAMINE